ncbi:MAG: hypothetical protein FJY83_04915 [Candidatus Aminicenantes bacterium]|nr:hypothetical protein [Candidatus Aminicenantes bacterium]
MNPPRTKTLVFLLPLILFSAFFLLKLTRPDFYASLIEEDSAIEYLQAVFYIAASVAALLVSIRLLRNGMTAAGILYALLAAGMLFASLEEISWGQRIFRIPSPAYFERHNWQRELSIHNLNGVQKKLHGIYVLVGACGSFAWILALVVFRGAKAGIRRLIDFVVPEWFISSYFFPTFLVYATFEFVSRPGPGTFLVNRDQEPAELLLSLGFLALAISKTIRLRQSGVVPARSRAAS